MISWILGKLRTLFLLAAIGGPALAGWMWWDESRIRDVEARGIEATAGITGATKTTRRRGGTSYDINLAWSDQKGQRRTASSVAVSSAFVGTIIVNDAIVRNSLRIKYLPDDDEAKPILIEDAGRQLETDRELMYLGAGAGAVGIIGSLLFLLGRRRQSQAA